MSIKFSELLAMINSLFIALRGVGVELETLFITKL